MTDLLVALGLVAVLEGILYAAAPGFMKRMLRQVELMPEQAMRTGGLIAMVVGVLLVWVGRG
ncbi:MAG TPA: DUF2065 domain-containing protein [Methylomirabilota bacterium]|nr:DUF2065 domain-containing protein [Methylomirabilota bacterium]